MNATRWRPAWVTVALDDQGCPACFAGTDDMCVTASGVTRNDHVVRIRRRAYSPIDVREIAAG